MRNDDFIELLHYIKLPCGTLLCDGTTYRLGKEDYPPRKLKKELEYFEKILVLSDGMDNVVGGVLFYGSYDIQVTVFPRQRGKGYMSAIHKNGILKSECYPGQQVSIAVDELRSMNDFLLRDHMLKMAGLRAKNLPEVYRHLSFFHMVDEYDEERFLQDFS